MRIPLQLLYSKYIQPDGGQCTKIGLLILVYCDIVGTKEVIAMRLNARTEKPKELTLSYIE